MSGALAKLLKQDASGYKRVAATEGSEAAVPLNGAIEAWVSAAVRRSTT